MVHLTELVHVAILETSSKTDTKKNQSRTAVVDDPTPTKVNAMHMYHVKRNERRRSERCQCIKHALKLTLHVVVCLVMKMFTVWICCSDMSSHLMCPKPRHFRGIQGEGHDASLEFLLYTEEYNIHNGKLITSISQSTAI